MFLSRNTLRVSSDNRFDDWRRSYRYGLGCRVSTTGLRLGIPSRDEWPDHWLGTIEPGADTNEEHEADDGASMFLLRAWTPYKDYEGVLQLVVLLVLTRIIDPVVDFLVETPAFVIDWTAIFGYEILEAEIKWANVPELFQYGLEYHLR